MTPPRIELEAQIQRIQRVTTVPRSQPYDIIYLDTINAEHVLKILDMHNIRSNAKYDILNIMGVYRNSTIWIANPGDAHK